MGTWPHHRPHFLFSATSFNRVGSRLQPPAWAVHEIQHRAVLFLNHVLQQEPEAQQRLVRQQGRVVLFEWRFVTMKRRRHAGRPARPGARGCRHRPHAQGDRGVARSAWPRPRCAATSRRCASRATCSWRPRSTGWSTMCAGTWRTTWPALIGDVPAHAIGNGARRVVAALRQFVGEGGRQGRRVRGRRMRRVLSRHRSSSGSRCATASTSSFSPASRSPGCAWWRASSRSAATSTRRAASACARRWSAWARSSSSSARCCRPGATCCRPTSPTSWPGCRTGCRPFDSKVAIATIERAFRRPVGEIFVQFDETPVASASIAQVHFATIRRHRRRRARGGGQGAAARHARA